MRIIFGMLFTLWLASLAIGQENMARIDHLSKRPEHLIAAPSSLKWEGNFSSVSGDPNKDGEAFVIRLKFSDGAIIPPHWHPIDENITVITGILLMGMGERFDETKTVEMPAGSFGFMPKEMRHFARAKGETIIQIHGTGPFKTFWVDPLQKSTK